MIDVMDALDKEKIYKKFQEKMERTFLGIKSPEERDEEDCVKATMKAELKKREELSQ